MKLILGRLRRFALLLSIASAGFAQMPANVEEPEGVGVLHVNFGVVRGVSGHKRS